MNGNTSRFDEIYETRPANRQPERWKDASPLGNGETGALLFGDIGVEHIRLTRSDLWLGGNDPVPPDVRETLGQTRALMDKKEYVQANRVLFDALMQSGYAPGLAAPFPLCDWNISFSYENGRFRDYRRILRLDTAESEVRYTLSGGSVTRECFVSRADGFLYFRVRSVAPISCTAALSLPAVNTHRDDPHTVSSDGTALTFLRPYDDGFCGARVSVVSSDGEVRFSENAVAVTDFTALTLALTAFSDHTKPISKPASSFDDAFEVHTAVYTPLYRRADIRLGKEDGSEGKSNEALTAEAFSGEMSSELLEKLWRFGRYLFLSGTCENGLPFPLYGLWTGDYDLMWAQHVSNENVQIIYWHILTGSLPELMLPLIRYFCEKIPQFKENAQNLFGCRGIVISAYTTPKNSHTAPPVPVILNFTTASGWLCRHFFDYYDLTHDEETLKTMILPFALETAAFFEDFAVIRDGVLTWYPSVSPENSPRQFIDMQNAMGHAMPTTKNATIELAIVKETLSRLSRLCASHGWHPEKLPVWEKLLQAIPPYACNEDGAVREWQDEDFLDFYCHRHLSHIYPVFPAGEVSRDSDPELFRAFEKAVDLRELGGQSGWSLAHMAGIFARMGRGSALADCLDLLCRGCLYDNFFTVHNDWRDDGLTLTMGNPPIQLDALMGAVNAVQQMLVDYDGGTLHLLPALPDRFPAGQAAGLAAPGCTVDLEWDRESGNSYAVLHAVRDGSFRVDYPVSGGTERAFRELRLRAGEYAKIPLSV